ncbi:unnamed protein product [Cyclocybe aegerita]|uniref:Peptidase C14 caspase domain-containing protein n=1 Tax=Cyclocybe aegerita TaxID=1973307 RepID=A0A8S0WN03_CYCAE|nr:unnamed protein product [Cyclocybe aegerita]
MTLHKDGGRMCLPTNSEFTSSTAWWGYYRSRAAPVISAAARRDLGYSTDVMHGPQKPGANVIDGRIFSLSSPEDVVEHFVISPSAWCVQDLGPSVGALFKAVPFSQQKPQRRKVAFLVGVTYSESLPELVWMSKEPTNDVACVKEVLTERFTFKEKDIIVLSEGDPSSDCPTQENILERCILHEDNVDYFFLFSGHSSQRDDATGIEEDGQEEYVIPCDAIDPSDGYIIEEKIITDKVLNTMLVMRLRKGCRLLAIADSCHSGTLLSASSPRVTHRPLIEDPQIYAINVVIEQEISRVHYTMLLDVGCPSRPSSVVVEPIFDCFRGTSPAKTISEMTRAAQDSLLACQSRSARSLWRSASLLVNIMGRLSSLEGAKIQR